MDGLALGSTEAIGSTVASGEGDGEKDGSAEGSIDGAMDGSADGTALGAILSMGEALGSIVGSGVGVGVGSTTAELVASSALAVFGVIIGARDKARKAGWRILREIEKSDQTATNFFCTLYDRNIFLFPRFRAENYIAYSIHCNASIMANSDHECQQL